MSTLELFFGEGNDLDPASMPAEHRESLQEWLARWDDGEGLAFLPRRHDGRLSWYGLFGTPTLRREVQALLPHWLGPAWSDAAERRGAVDLDDQFDRRLEDALPDRVVRVDVSGDDDRGVDSDARDVVRHRLEGMLRLLDARPPRRGGPSKHVSVLLDELDVAATGGNVRAAEEMLEELEQRRLLDAPNSTFTEVRVRSLLGQHHRVVDPDLLERLVGLTLPHGVALPLARSAHEIYTREADERGDANTLLEARGSMPRGLARILQHVPGSTTERAALVVQAVALGANPSFAALLRGRLPDDDHLRELVETTGSPDAAPGSATTSSVAEATATYDVTSDAPTAEAAPPEVSTHPRTESSAATPAPDVFDPTSQVLADLYNDGAYETLIDIATTKDTPLDHESHTWCVLAAHELFNPRTTEAVLDMVERDLGAVEDVEWPKRILRIVVAELVESLTTEDSVTSWADWFDRTQSGDPPNEEDLHGAADWPPLETHDLLGRLDALADPTVLAPVIGRLRAAHLPVMTPKQRGRLGSTCLTVLSMAETRETSVLAATSDFVRDVVDAGLGDDALRGVLGDVSDLVERQLAPGSAEWAVDLMSELVDAAGPHLPLELSTLLVKVVDRLRPALTTIPRSLWRQLDGLFRQVGAGLPADIVVRLEADPTPDPLSWVAGKTVFLYSLRERPARQAAARLREAGASEVTLSAETHGSTRLESQVAGKDIVVIVTSEATHAATGVIEDAATTPDLIRIHAAGPSRLLDEIGRFGAE